MWKFDADDYVKRVLSPAVDAFKNDGSVPDIFARYDLPLDVSEAADIETALNTVGAYWNKTKNNPRFGQLLAVLLKEGGERQKDSLRILSDPVARETQRAIVKEARKKQLEARFQTLDASIGVVAAKGFITPKEKAALLARFQREGLTEQDILSRIHIPERDAAKKLPTDEGLLAVLRSKIRNGLGVLKKNSLYDFLGISPEATKKQVEERHRELYLEWDRKPNDFHKTAALELLGIVKTHLVTGGLGKYEAARVYDIVDKLRPEVILAASDKRITRDEFEHLTALAVRFGLESSKAADFVLSLAEETSAAVEWSPGEETMRCANCAAAVAKKENKCTACGSDLWTNCPRCTKRMAVSEAACGKCGFVIANFLKMRLLVRTAQLALNEGALADALKAAKEAEQLWERQGDVDLILKKIETRIEELGQLRRKVDEALSAKKLYAAQRSLAALAAAAPHYKGSDGKSVQDLQRDLEVKIRSVESSLQKALEHERKGQLNEAVYAYQDALAVADDAEDARKGLSRCPPEPPSQAKATSHQDHVLVEWQAAPAVGSIEYCVVRCEGRAPASRADGELLTCTTALSWRDEHARPASFVFYSIFAERGGTLSKAASTAGVLIVREVSNFVLDAGDNVVRGSWEYNVPEGRVRVFCKEGSPPGRQDGHEIQLSGPHSFVDTAVVNGRLYYYRVVVEYHDPSGRSVFTPGIVASVRPEHPPDPVQHLVITLEEGVLSLLWTKPAHGAVSIYRATREPEWRCGTQIPAGSLSALGARLRSKSDNQAIDPSPPNSPVFYVPVTVAGDTAVMGAARRYVASQDVAYLQAQDFGQYLLLQWHWPSNCRTAVVAWRADAFPLDVNDPLAARRQVSKGEYERHGGFRIENPAKAPYKFVVFAATEIEGENVYSAGIRPGARAELRARLPVTITYSISRGTFRRNRITLTLSAEEKVDDLPQIVLVAKHGDLQPLRSDDGTVLATIGRLSLAAKSQVSHQFELNGIRRPLYLRAFFLDPSSSEKFLLADPSPSQLKVT
jgi:tetratricopeptide (TPR) repeat protein